MRWAFVQNPGGPRAVELIATFWWLDLKSELVFVGDEGTTEIRGPTQTLRAWRWARADKSGGHCISTAA